MRAFQIVILAFLSITLSYGVWAQAPATSQRITASAPVPANAFRVGAAKIDITPSTTGGGARGGGAAGGFPGSDGILDHIYSRAIVIDNGTTRAALVAVDTGAVGEQTWKSVSQRIEKELGIPAQNLIINPVHTHSASGGTADQIFSTIKAAKEKLQPARIGYGTGVSYINIDRNIIDPKTHKWWEGAN